MNRSVFSALVLVAAAASLVPFGGACGKPDLIVEDVWTEPDPVVEAESYRIVARVRNQGDKKASCGIICNIEVDFYVDGTEQSGKEGNFDDLAAGSCQNVESGSLTGPACGAQHTMKAKVDPNLEIDESDEGNNWSDTESIPLDCITCTITVQSDPGGVRISDPDGGGTTPYSRTKTCAQSYWLEAPSIASGRPFEKWLKNGSFLSANRRIDFNVADGDVYKAVYDGVTRKLSVPDADCGVDEDVDLRVNLDNGSGVLGFAFDAVYPPSKLTYASVSKGSLTGGWGTPTVNPQSGRIVIANAGTTALSGSGSLVVLKFHAEVKGDHAVGLENAELNDGAIPVSTTGATVHVTEEQFRWGAVTGTNGEPDDVVGTMDASEILQWKVCLIDQFSGYPEIVKPDYPPAADVSGDGACGTMDASEILRKKVGLITKFSADTNGDGMGPESVARRLMLQSPEVTVSVPAQEGSVCNEVTVPMEIDEASGVLGYFVEFAYPAELADYVETVKGSLTAGWGDPTVNPQEGKVSIAGAGAQELSGSGSLVEVKLHLKAPGNGMMTLPVVELNDGAIPATSEGGQLTVHGEPPPTGTINIEVDPDEIEGEVPTWTLEGPDLQTQDGQGDAQLTEMPVGTYTVTWHDVTAANWVTPEGESRELTASSTITFKGTWKHPGRITVQSNIGAQYILRRLPQAEPTEGITEPTEDPKVFQRVHEGMEAGIWQISWPPSPDSNAGPWPKKPVEEQKEMPEGGSITFTKDYIVKMPADIYAMQAAKIDYSTGTFFMRVFITNTTGPENPPARTFTAPIWLVVTDIVFTVSGPNSEGKLWNPDGQTCDEYEAPCFPYVDLGECAPLDPGETSQEFELEFYIKDRNPNFEPVFQVWADDPVAAGSSFRVERVISQPGGSVLVQWASVQGGLYVVEVADSPMGPWLPISGDIRSVGDTTEWLDTPPADVKCQFYRLRAVSP